MPKTQVQKSITIDASAQKVKSIVSDFNHWAVWSPWLILEPDCKVTVSENGKMQEWEGKRIGSGRIEVLKESDSEVNYDLTFLKPWKSKAKTDFIIDGVDENTTKLTWTMDGSLPFFMFWMKTMMERLIGMDYDRGLLMLKQYIENGAVDVKLEFMGESEFEGCNYVGIKNECTIDNIKEVMQADFARLADFAEKNADILTEDWFAIYHKYDFNKNKVVYTGGIGIKENPEKLPAGFISDRIEASKIQTVRHHGTYELLGNAWSAIMAMERSKEFKKKKMPPMEFYRNDPRETAPKDLISDICMAVK